MYRKNRTQKRRRFVVLRCFSARKSLETRCL